MPKPKPKPKPLFELEPEPPRGRASGAAHLAIGDIVVHGDTGDVGMLVTLGLRRSRLKFGADGPFREYNTGGLRPATRAELRGRDELGRIKI